MEIKQHDSAQDAQAAGAVPGESDAAGCGGGGGVRGSPLLGDASDAEVLAMEHIHQQPDVNYFDVLEKGDFP